MVDGSVDIQMDNPGGPPVVIRSRTSQDHALITRMYEEILADEVDFFIVNVRDSLEIARWFEPNEFVQTIALVAEVNREIVGEAVLMRQKNPRLSHVGNIRFYIRPEWRKAGLGATLVSSLFTQATRIGIEKICIDLPDPAARKFDSMLTRNGFSREAVLHNHFRSGSGEKMDIVIYGRDLEELWHRISDWVSNYGRAMEY
ncbi:GNAT family N-acetyltransferase [bacterium]|nr:GNAT family N-acetyltransferase [candidate division CSSED10-310 bacterium]